MTEGECLLRWVLIGVFVLCAMLAGCSSGLDVPLGPWALAAQSQHVRYYTLGSPAGRAHTGSAAQRLESLFEEAAPVWGVPDSLRVRYYRFSSPEELSGYTARNVTSVALPASAIIHGTRDVEAHEMGRLLVLSPLYAASGHLDVPSFWVDGVGMYYSWPRIDYADGDPRRVYEARLGADDGRSVNGRAADLLASGALPHIGEVQSSSQAFEALEKPVRRSVAGSFVTYLLGAGTPTPEGVERMKEFLAAVNRAGISAGEANAAFAEAFGRTVPQADEQWRARLALWDESSVL